VYFGFSGDAHAAPDLKRMETLLKESFTELRDAVGLRPPDKKPAKKKRARQKREPAQASAAPKETVPEPASLSTSFAPLESKRQPEPTLTLEQENARTQFIVA
jgi:hypothetical protein